MLGARETANGRKNTQKIHLKCPRLVSVLKDRLKRLSILYLRGESHKEATDSKHNAPPRTHTKPKAVRTFGFFKYAICVRPIGLPAHQTVPHCCCLLSSCYERARTMSFWNFVKLARWWARFASCGYLIAWQPQVGPMAGTECVERVWTDGCLDEAGSIGGMAVRPAFYN